METNESKTNVGEGSTSELTRLLCALNRDERSAFSAFFYGGRSEVVKYENMSHVYFGKAECEWVDFDEFWLGKMVEYGWIEVEIVRSYIAKGAIDKPKATVYKLIPTELGYKALELSRGLIRVSLSETGLFGVAIHADEFDIFRLQP